MSHAKGRGAEDRIHNQHSPFVGVASLQEPNLLSYSEILKATTDRINKIKDPLHENALVAYEFIEESTEGWRWSIGEVKEFTEHTVTIQKWRCEKGSNADLVEALRRDQLVKTKLLKESSQSIFALRAELGSVRTKNEAEMARARSELQDRQEPLSVADDGVWKTILSAAGSSKPGARSVQQLITTVVGLIDQRFPNHLLSWVDVQRAAQHTSFLDRVYRYDVWYDMSTEQFKVAKALLDEDEDLQPASFESSVRDVGLRGEAAAYAESLYLWLTAQVQVFTTYLGCASTQEYANSLQQQLFDCVQNLKELNRKLAQIKQELELYAKGGIGIQGSKSGSKQASLTFVPTSGIFSTILRSSIVLVLREKSKEVVVLGNEDVDEILECSGHHRPSLHAIAGELIQLTSGANTEGERRKASEDLEELRNRLADVQKELEAQREESLASDQEARELRKLLQREKEKGDNRIRGENEELKELRMESAQLKKEAKEVEKELALRESKQLEEVKVLRAENKKLQEELQIAEKEHSRRDSAQLDDVKTLQKENAKLRDEIREKEKEISKQDGMEKEELKELRSENRKLREEARKAEEGKSKRTETRHSVEDGEAMKVLKEENRKLRDDLRRAEREKRKSIPTIDGIDGNSRRYSSSRELEEERRKNKVLDSSLRASVEEIEYLQEKLRELQRQQCGHSLPSQGMSSSAYHPLFSSNNKSGGPSFVTPLDSLMWEEKCGRVKIENSMNHIWASFVALDRDVLFSFSQRRAQELLEELDALSFDYTDSLEKLEEFIGFIEDARSSENQLRARLTATEDALIHLQSFCDQYDLARKMPPLAALGETIGTRSAQLMNPFAAAAESRDPRASAKRQDLNALLQRDEAVRRQLVEKSKENEERKKRNEDMKRENEELLQLVKRLPAAGHRSQPYGGREDSLYGDSPSRSPYGGWSQGSRLPSSSDRRVAENGDGINADEASFKEVFLRMKGQMEILKQQKEALVSELDDRDQEIERISQRRLGSAPDRFAFVG